MQLSPYQMFLGVTGHRELANVPETEEAVRQLIQQLKGILHCPAETNGSIEFSIVSSLAKGADQIVASVSIDELDANLQAVSPFLLDEYRKDFAEPNELQAFDELWKCDQNPTVLNHDVVQGLEDPTLRSRAYLDAGKFVVNSCEILIAVWDGSPAKGTGGTGDVVEYALKRNRTVLWIDSRDPQKEHRILIGEQSEDGTEFMSHTAKQLSLGFHRYRAFAADNMVHRKTIDRATQAFTQDLQSQGISTGFPENWIEDGQELLGVMTRADLLAIEYQKKYLFGAKSLFRLSALAVTVAVFQVLFFPHALWIIIFEVLAMLLAAGLLLLSRREAWHEKWLNDRYIAEWLRTTVYRSFGEESRLEASQTADLLPFYAGPDQWFVSAFAQSMERFQASLPKVEFQAQKQFLIENWIRTQAAYHERNAHRKEQTHAQYERFGLACFLITIFMATLHMFGVGHQHAVDSHNANHHEVHHVEDVHSTHDNGSQSEASISHHNHLTDVSLWISFFAIVLPAWGAATHAIASLLEYERIAKRSERMSKVLTDLADRAEQATTPKELATYLGQARSVMLAETQEWLISLSFRGLKLPA